MTTRQTRDRVITLEALMARQYECYLLIRALETYNFEFMTPSIPCSTPTTVNIGNLTDLEHSFDMPNADDSPIFGPSAGPITSRMLTPTTPERGNSSGLRPAFTSPTHTAAAGTGITGRSWMSTTAHTGFPNGRRNAFSFPADDGAARGSLTGLEPSEEQSTANLSTEDNAARMMGTTTRSWMSTTANIGFGPIGRRLAIAIPTDDRATRMSTADLKPSDEHMSYLSTSNGIACMDITNTNPSEESSKSNVSTGDGPAGISPTLINTFNLSTDDGTTGTSITNTKPSKERFKSNLSTSNSAAGIDITGRDPSKEVFTFKLTIDDDATGTDITSTKPSKDRFASNLSTRDNAAEFGIPGRAPSEQHFTFKLTIDDDAAGTDINGIKPSEEQVTDDGAAGKSTTDFKPPESPFTYRFPASISSASERLRTQTPVNFKLRIEQPTEASPQGTDHRDPEPAIGETQVSQQHDVSSDMRQSTPEDRTQTQDASRRPHGSTALFGFYKVSRFFPPPANPNDDGWPPAFSHRLPRSAGQQYRQYQCDLPSPPQIHYPNRPGFDYPPAVDGGRYVTTAQRLFTNVLFSRPSPHTPRWWNDSDCSNTDRGQRDGRNDGHGIPVRKAAIWVDGMTREDEL